MSRSTVLRSLAVGVAIGVADALSPLSVWFMAAALVLTWWAGRGLEPHDRRRVFALLVFAIGARLIAVLALFMMTNHESVAFRTFFGDEEFFIRRAIWLRNIGLGLPVHPADLIYSFDDVGTTSYLYVLAAIQVLAGPAPYGVHLVAIILYLAATVLLFRIAYGAFGRMPALLGLVVLLFLPSLFAWSISALKEPAFFLLTALATAGVRRAVRVPGIGRRAWTIAAVLAMMAIGESVRRAGAAIIAVGLGMGAAAAFVLPRPRWVVAAVVAVPMVVGVAASRPRVQLAAYAAIKRAAWQHSGHVFTRGYVYKTLDDRFYINTANLDDMRAGEAGRFLARSLAAYVTVPLPWQMQSRAALAFMPEQVVWYGLLLLLPPGLVFALRRDTLLTALLASEAIVAAVLVALTGGNIGTLVRHRGMAIPYLVWIGAVGACELLGRAANRAESDAVTRPLDGIQRIEPSCP